jgi:AcrR family transcriptional regulator
MATDENKKNRIMEYAFKSFMNLGVSRVTMDDIARGVGMGKGTVYKLFPSKEALLLSTVDYFAAQVEKAIEEVLSNDTLAPYEKLNLFLKTAADKISVINPELLNYLERSMPEVYQKIESTRQRIIMNNFIRLLGEGKKCGFYDSQMDEKLVAHIVIGAVKEIVEGRKLESLGYSLEQLFKTLISIIFEGVLTEKGRKQILKD